MEDDIRWKQRFDNFKNSILVLERVTADITPSSSPNETTILATIQAFEMTFELAWKVCKDYLNKSGLDVKLPKPVLKEAVNNQLIKNIAIWADMLELRNLTSHTYDPSLAKDMVLNIKTLYLPELKLLHDYFKDKI